MSTISSLSSDNFKHLIENNADGIVVVSHNGTIRYVNQAAERLLGRSLDQLKDKELGVPITPGETTEIDLICCEEGRVAEMRVVATEWDGESAYLASLRDITERKQVEAAFRFLSEASRLLNTCAFLPEATVQTVGELAVQHLADWCLIDLLDADDFIHRTAVCQDCFQPEKLNDFRGSYPVSLDRQMGPIHVLRTGELEVHPSVTPELLDSLCLEDDQRELVELLGCRSLMMVPISDSGRVLPRPSRMDPKEGKESDSRPLLGVITFIISKAGRSYHQAEQTLAQDLARRAALALENSRLYDEAREGIHRRDQFLAMLGHELRNPLAPILTAAWTLRARGEAISPETNRAVTVIERQAKHLIRLVDDLLDLSRVSRGRIQLRRKAVDVHPLVDDAVQASRSWIDARQQRLFIHREQGRLTLKADPTRLTQIIVNLLNNASRYTPIGGRIDLMVEEEGTEIVLRVRDSGVGIPSAMLRRIFEPFVQIGPTLDRAEGGMGIGLALVQRLVHLHGGSIRATSPGEDQGTEMIVRLPAVQAPPVQRSSAAKKASVPAMPLRVLLIEDKQDAREMLRDLLQLWGHEVQEASDGLEGMNAICSWRPDIALVDIGLPTLDGYEIAKRIGKMEDKPETVLVALTGYGQETDKEEALAAGFQAHIVKPVDLDRLAQLLALVGASDVAQARSDLPLV